MFIVIKVSIEYIILKRLSPLTRKAFLKKWTQKKEKKKKNKLKLDVNFSYSNIKAKKI